MNPVSDHSAAAAIIDDIKLEDVRGMIITIGFQGFQLFI